jgi:penicillin-binding protein 1A
MRRSEISRRGTKPKPRPIRWFLFAFLAVFTCALAIGGLCLFAFYVQLDRSLPSTRSLKNYHPPLVTTVYSSDGTLIGEFYAERRYLVPLKEVPLLTRKAFMAAEDARFYEHGGVDLAGVARAFFKNLKAGEIVQGGSTITQQVVKSLLLTPEKTWLRKLKEAILAYRIDHALTKDEILYLYLNQIYFGAGAYGVEAAARTYFDKHASELDVAESALLAGLPKAPTKFSPIQHYAAARERQHYVLQRMAEVGFITPQEARQAADEQLHLVKPKHWTLKDLDSFTEEVRRQVEARYGHDGLYKEGLTVYTTMKYRAQKIAEKALDQGLRELDRRHRRYRGLHDNLPKDDWPGYLKSLAERNGALSEGKVVGALVLQYDARSRTSRLDLGSAKAKLPPSGYEWTQASPKRVEKMFRPGDLIRVRLAKLENDGSWSAVLEQDPGMQGALMAMDPDTGAVLCMVGGRDFEKSQFNRCTQSLRQPGSAFKPIIYAAALDRGYNEASILIDSPFIRDDHSLNGPWKPANYDNRFWGPITLRTALINSRNVVTVKLLDSIGVDYAIKYARRLGITTPLTPTLSLALGASGVSLWELLSAYSTFADQGERVEPYLIQKVLDRNGNVLEQHQVHKEEVISPQTAYLITDLLQGVVQQGTGTRAKALGRPAAGKTGTTNEMKDAWFMGYTPDVLTGVWVGYDDHNISLGKGETGGRAACPIWVYFMQELLKDKPVLAFPIPPGIVFARVNTQTEGTAQSGHSGASYAAFAGSPPSEQSSAGEQDQTAEQSAGEQSGAPAHSPNPSESFFKSDLF